MRFDLVFNTLIIAFLAGIIIYTRQNWLPESEVSIDASKVSDYFIDDFQVEQFSESGKLTYLVQGQQFRHFTDETGEVDQPIGIFSDAEHKRKWRATSETAIINITQKQMQLYDDVKVTNDSFNQPIELSSDAIFIDQQNNVIETDSTITLTVDNGELRGVGLIANLDNETIKIKQHVRTHYTLK